MLFLPFQTHLANQDVTHCIRQEEGYCAICYEPTIKTAAVGKTILLYVLPIST